MVCSCANCFYKQKNMALIGVGVPNTYIIELMHQTQTNKRQSNKKSVNEFPNMLMGICYGL